MERAIAVSVSDIKAIIDLLGNELIIGVYDVPDLVRFAELRVKLKMMVDKIDKRR